jgi:hypothetical protein
MPLATMARELAKFPKLPFEGGEYLALTRGN